MYNIKIKKKRELTMQYMSEEIGRKGANMLYFRLIIRLLPIITIINYCKNSEMKMELTVLY